MFYLSLFSVNINLIVWSRYECEHDKELNEGIVGITDSPIELKMEVLTYDLPHLDNEYF